MVETSLLLAGAGASVNLSVLRTFRIMRAFKLARSFKGLRLILKTIKDSLEQARDLSLLLVLCMFIFSLLGMELFSGSFGECAVAPADGRFSNARAACLAAANGSSDAWEVHPNRTRNPNP